MTFDPKLHKREYFVSYDLEDALLSDLPNIITKLQEQVSSLGGWNATLVLKDRDYSDGKTLAIEYTVAKTPEDLETARKYEEFQLEYQRKEYERLKKQFGGQ